VQSDDNDGRRPVGWLPEVIIEGIERPVVQVIAEASGEILYTVRVRENRFQPHVYSEGSFTVKFGLDRPESSGLTGMTVSPTRAAAGAVNVVVDRLAVSEPSA
jgi:hypothetical protein